LGAGDLQFYGIFLTVTLGWTFMLLLNIVGPAPFRRSVEETIALLQRNEIKSRYKVDKVFTKFKLFDTPPIGAVVLFSSQEWEKLVSSKKRKNIEL
jgi:hypothetical protein